MLKKSNYLLGVSKRMLIDETMTSEIIHFIKFKKTKKNV